MCRLSRRINCTSKTLKESLVDEVYEQESWKIVLLTKCMSKTPKEILSKWLKDVTKATEWRSSTRDIPSEAGLVDEWMAGRYLECYVIATTWKYVHLHTCIARCLYQQVPIGCTVCFTVCVRLWIVRCLLVVSATNKYVSSQRDFVWCGIYLCISTIPLTLILVETQILYSICFIVSLSLSMYVLCA